MTTNTLGDEVSDILRGASDYIRSNRPDERRQQFHMRNLQSAEARVAAEIKERETGYKEQLQAKESADLDALWEALNRNPRFQRASAHQKACQETFEDLRQVNGGAFPKNISPVIYVIPLIGIGVAEWYVNFSTFAARFIPVFAISGTLIVAAIFAWASHHHGSYIKQLSEILHPSVEYRNELGRKIALVIATVMLIVALFTVISLRYLVIADQLGITSTSAGTFGGSNAALIWSNLGPTILLNILIWGLGTLYAYTFSEKVPRLREEYRELLHVNRELDSIRRPSAAEEKRIKAHYDREQVKNEVGIKEYETVLESVKGMIQRIQS
jgi:hypothetical protein